MMVGDGCMGKECQYYTKVYDVHEQVKDKWYTPNFDITWECCSHPSIYIKDFERNKYPGRLLSSLKKCPKKG